MAMPRLSPIVLAASLALAACRSDPGSTRGVAERFLDAHYVAIDLAAAETFTAGLAGKKVSEERRLTEGQAIDENTLKPTVHYRLLEEHPDGEDRSRFLYQASFSVSGAGQFERRILLVLHRNREGWKVVNFEEFE
jgi:hypothetical protein